MTSPVNATVPLQVSLTINDPDVVAAYELLTEHKHRVRRNPASQLCKPVIFMHLPSFQHHFPTIHAFVYRPFMVTFKSSPATRILWKLSIGFSEDSLITCMAM